MPWYYATNGERKGPVEEARIRALAREGVIQPDDLVWTESFGDSWQPVANPSGYGVAKNQYNEVTFQPVKTTELKIEIQFQPGRYGSLIRWRVE